MYCQKSPIGEKKAAIKGGGLSNGKAEEDLEGRVENRYWKGGLRTTSRIKTASLKNAAYKVKCVMSFLNITI